MNNNGGNTTPINDQQKLRHEFIHHLSRPFVNVSSASNKIMSTLLRYNLDGMIENVAESNYLALGEGSGSICHLMIHLFKPNIFIYNTIMDYETNPTIDTPYYIPPSLLGDKCINHQDLSRTRQPLLYGETDILSSRFDLKLNSILEGIGKFSLITCDAEGKEGNNKVILSYLISKMENLMDDNGMAIIKTFKPDFLEAKAEMTSEDIKSLNEKFYFTGLKPINSNPNSSELYLIICKLEKSSEYGLECYDNLLASEVKDLM